MQVTIEKNELVVRIPLQKPTASSSGKTLVVASSRGNQKTDCVLKDYGAITVGINAYVKPGEVNGQEPKKAGKTAKEE